MGPIERIIIGGFRGILAPLPLEFVRDRTPRSMVIYGRNGTGKSSITDAWEWLHTEKIEHLAREGARQSSYAHRNAKDHETFVEVQFAGDDLGTVRLDFVRSRITMPAAKGAIARFRALAPHPCHIRFGDLTRFVYLTKAEKYDALAQLMGFTPQVSFQKALRRVLRQVSDELAARKRNVAQQESTLSKSLTLPIVDEPSILDRLTSILERHGIKPPASIKALQTASKEPDNIGRKRPSFSRVGRPWDSSESHRRSGTA